MKVPSFAEWCKAERENEIYCHMEMSGNTREEAEAKVHPNYPRGPAEMLPTTDDSELSF